MKERNILSLTLFCVQDQPMPDDANVNGCLLIAFLNIYNQYTYIWVVRRELCIYMCVCVCAYISIVNSHFVLV